MADLVIVDDDVDVADMLSEILRADGHAVRVARNGREGMAVLHERQPDLVLLDVEMPVLTGPETAVAMMVHNVGLQHVPIILCSGVLDLPKTAALVGTPYFIAKPFKLDAIRALIDRALTERRPPHPVLPDLPGAAP
jgi:DNA-binding NtrC family response regulator